MTYIIILFLIWISLFLCGFLSAPFFARFSDTGALDGLKNFIRMHVGLWRLKLECPTELADTLKKELNEPSPEPPTLEAMNLNYFERIHDKHIWTVLYAYLQRKQSRYIQTIDQQYITLYNGRTLSDEKRDVRNIFPSTVNDGLTLLEKRVLASARLRRDRLHLVDHLYIQIMQKRHGQDTFILPKQSEQIASTIFTYGTDNVKRDALHILQRRRHFVFLHRVIKATNNVEKE